MVDGRSSSGDHDRHDPEQIAALLDRDLPDADRAFARARVAACPACAALHTDLLTLATAILELPTPVRLRDYSLTPTVAASLVLQASGEPVPAGPRLTADMTDSRSPHAGHDRLLIANLVDRSVSRPERNRGEDQLAACRDCAQLYDDLVALSNATRALPVPSRPRDFTLTPGDAERLRVRGWRHLLSAIGSPRDAFSRPLALGLTTLGLAGLLVATIPSALTGVASSPQGSSTAGDAARNATGAAVAAPETSGSQVSEAPGSGPAEFAPPAAAQPAPAASEAADLLPVASAEAGAEGPGESNGFIVGGDPTAPAGDQGDGFVDLTAKSLTADEPMLGGSMIVVAGLLLVAGLGLFGLRWVARRLRED